jgi:hypothetical protein
VRRFETLVNGLRQLVNETDRVRPPEPASNDFAWPPPGWDADVDILWLEPEPSPAPTTSDPTSPALTSDAPVPLLKAATSASVPVSDLLSRGVPFEWPEVVALVQELGDALQGSGPSRSLLTLDAVALEPDGRIRANLEPGPVPIVRSLGHVLDQLLTTHPGPANLRLIAMQASSEASTFASAEELARSLANFERPGRLKALTALYERARQAGLPVTPVAAPPKPVVHVEILPTPIAAAEPEKRHVRFRPPALEWRQKQLVIAAVGVATVCLALTGVVVALWARPLPVAAPRVAVEQPQAPPAPDAGVPEQEIKDLQPSAARAAVSPAVRSSVSPAVRSPGSADVRPAVRAANVPAPVQRPVVPTVAGAPVRPPASAAPSVAAVRLPAVPQISPIAEQEFVRARTLFDRRQFAAAAAGFQRVIDILSNGELSPSSSTLRSTASELAAISLASVSSVPDSRVYSRVDEGVIEPVAIREFLPQEPIPGAAASDPSVLELLIDSRGFVESVRLRNPQNRYRDKWFLSAAKSWRFQPALKDGQPVKYLKRIPLTAF